MKTDFTAQLLTDAGIGAGMRVLDIGCGAGEVSRLASRIVQGTGSVVGVDINEHMLTRAEALTHEQQLSNIDFIQANLSQLPFDTNAFDAVIGRRILMYLPDAVEIVHQLSHFVKPGGIFVFQENDSTFSAKGTTAMPLHDKVVHWIWRTVAREGADIHMGFNLPKTMRAAGIDVAHVRAEPVIQWQGGHNSPFHILKAILPRVIEHGVASEVEVDIDTLEKRLAAEFTAGAIYISDMTFGVWGHKP